MNSAPRLIPLIVSTVLVMALVGCLDNGDSTAPPVADKSPQVRTEPQTADGPRTEIPRVAATSADNPDSEPEQNGLPDDANPHERQPDPPQEEDQLPSLADVAANPIDPDEDPYSGDDPDESIPEIQTIEIPSSWKRLSEQQEIWVDMQNKQVIAAGNICLTDGALEMFICPRRTKEHESVISLNALSSQVHAALLAVGATPGHPVRWRDKYEPVSGPVIQITVMWKDEAAGKIVERRGQEMVRNIDTGKAMTLDWIFGGSETGTNTETGETFYYGDSGELVCLSNFSTATMDVPVESTDSEFGLLFAANAPNIPDLGTKVYVKFKPVLK